jgi:uncharacterized protein
MQKGVTKPMYDPYYIKYLALFHGPRDYFECHEVLEERWKMDQPLERDSIFVAFIQLAVSQYHHRNKNYIGAKKLIQKSIEKFYKNEHLLEAYGLNKDLFLQLLEKVKSNIIHNKPYSPFCFPFHHDDIKHLVDIEREKLMKNYIKKALDNS